MNGNLAIVQKIQQISIFEHVRLRGSVPSSSCILRVQEFEIGVFVRKREKVRIEYDLV